MTVCCSFLSMPIIFWLAADGCRRCKAIIELNELVATSIAYAKTDGARLEQKLQDRYWIYFAKSQIGFRLTVNESNEYAVLKNQCIELSSLSRVPGEVERKVKKLQDQIKNLDELSAILEQKLKNRTITDEELLELIGLGASSSALHHELLKALKSLR